MAVRNAHTGRSGFQPVLERCEIELLHTARSRDQVCIERSADPIDELQLASERELAIQILDRESVLLSQVRDALSRLHGGNFGTCIDCEQPISPKRLAVVPWIPRGIRCQEVADWKKSPDFAIHTLADIA
jgi:DnaK suppressor protein